MKTETIESRSVKLTASMRISTIKSDENAI